MRVVLDTNVIISGLIRPENSPGLILDHWQQRSFIAALSQDSHRELNSVMTRPEVERYFRRSPEWIDRFTRDLREFAVYVTPAPVNVVPTDPPDNLIVGTAIAAECNYLVSGNRHILELGSYQGVQMITPHQFLLVLHNAM